jgi:hypothetical protein
MANFILSKISCLVPQAQNRVGSPLYAQSRRELLGQRALGGTKYPDSVATTWLTTMHRLGPLAIAILRLASFLGLEHQGVHRWVLGETQKALEEGMRESFPDNSQGNSAITALAFHLALGELASYSMINLRDDGFSIHRLVQAVVQDGLSESAYYRWSEQAVRVVLYELIEPYSSGESRQPPLSIVVFGYRWSAAHSVIVQAAKSVCHGELAVLRFNLTEFAGSKDLFGAFQKVMQLGSSKQMPLVFWENFDTALEGQPRGWLKFFLAPMHDGEFVFDQTRCAFGKAIFVFASNTHDRFSDWQRESERKAGEWKETKEPDFISRLQAGITLSVPSS